MSNKTSIITTLLMAATVCVTALSAQPSQAQQISFTCTVDTDNVPTTYAQTPDDTVPVFKWTSNYFRPPYTPMQRCQEVAERMNNFYAQEQMDYLTSGRVNNLPVICAGTSCETDGSNVLITLKPNQNANQVLQEIDANRSGAGGPSYQFSAGTTGLSLKKPSSLTRNSNGTVSLDMNRYLETSSANKPQPSQPSQNTTPGVIQPTNPSNSKPVPRRTW